MISKAELTGTRVNGPLFWTPAVAGDTADSMNKLSAGPLSYI